MNESESKSKFCLFVQSVLMYYFCENSWNAYPALILKDTFALHFADIQAILNSVDMLEDRDVTSQSLFCCVRVL